MSRIIATFGLCFVLIAMSACGGGSSNMAAPTPTPPQQVFPNDTASAQPAPIKLGTSGGNSKDVGTKLCCIGTLGSLWTRPDIARPVILSNNHVLAESDNGDAAPGNPIDQPLQVACTAIGAPAPLIVALLTQAVPLKPVANVPGACGNPAPSPLCGPAPKNVDAAIAEINTGQVDLSGTILDLGAVGSSSISPAPPSGTIATPALGQAVGKSGRTSGLTCSTISSIGNDFQVDYDASCGGAKAFTAIFKNQLMIAGATFSDPGDSGSLVVTTDTARAVGLLYAGNSTGTAAHPIQDVIAALSNASGPLTIVGGADHPVSCAHTATANAAQLGTTQSALVPEERQRVLAVQKRHAHALMRDFGFTAVESGASSDNPHEGALVLHVAGTSVPSVPALIDGVRTRLVFDDVAAGAHIPPVTAGQIAHALKVKDAHAPRLMGQPGIQGVGVAISNDNPTETAIAIHLLKGVPHQPIPATIDGIRTRVFEGTRLKAY